jgi:hypothetical protein
MRHLTLRSRALFSQSIILNYKDLKSGKNLEDAIEKAYGPKGKLSYQHRPRHSIC